MEARAIKAEEAEDDQVTTTTNPATMEEEAIMAAKVEDSSRDYLEGKEIRAAAEEVLAAFLEVKETKVAEEEEAGPVTTTIALRVLLTLLDTVDQATRTLTALRSEASQVAANLVTAQHPRDRHCPPTETPLPPVEET